MGNNERQPSGKVYRIVVLTFQGAGTAKEVFNNARSGGVLDGLKVLSKSLVERDAAGEVKVHETGRGGLGGAIGAIGGGALGLLAGPAGLFWMLVSGGVAGGLIGHFAGRAIPKDELRKIGEAFPNDSSGIMLLLEDKEAEKAIKELEGVQADVLTIDLGEELSGVVAESVFIDATVEAETGPDGSAGAEKSTAQVEPGADDAA